jgi:hypothetical protein
LKHAFKQLIALLGCWWRRFASCAQRQEFDLSANAAERIWKPTSDRWAPHPWLKVEDESDNQNEYFNRVFQLE